MIDEQFKADVLAFQSEMRRVVMGDEKEKGLVHEVRNITRIVDGGTVAVKLLLFLGSIAAAIATGFAWLHDKVNWK